MMHRCDLHDLRALCARQLQAAVTCRHRLSNMSGGSEAAAVFPPADTTAAAAAAAAAAAEPAVAAASAQRHISAVLQAAGTPALSAAAAASLPASVLASAAASDGRTTLSSGDGFGVPDAASRITHYLPPDLVPDVWRGHGFRLYPWQVSFISAGIGN
jgi:hypothetical protein